MSSYKLSSVLGAVGLASVVAAGCSSSNGGGGGSPADAGPDGLIVIHKMDDAAKTDDGGLQGNDGTSGKPCHSDIDCVGADGGPGINKCSSDYAFDIGGVRVALSSTPVCIVGPPATGGPTCDPAPATDPTGQLIHFCDGPDDPSSPSICAPGTNPPSPGQGTCLPKCSFKIDGTPTTGCAPGAACQPLSVILDMNNAITGYGVCQGFCSKDSDCSPLGTGFVCQTDIGFCTKARVNRTKHLGDSCTMPASPTATSPCNCVTGMSNAGFCTQACVVGGAPCPNGWVCDANTVSTLDFGTGTTYTVTQQNPGTEGFCAPPCSIDDGGAAPAATDAGAAPDSQAPGDASPPPEASTMPAQCPANSVCQTMTVAGPDCLPQ